MANPSFVSEAAGATRRSGGEAEPGLPARLAALASQVNDRRLDGVRRGLGWLEIGRIHRILDGLDEAIDAFRKAHRCFKAGGTREAEVHRALARAGEALVLVRRSRRDDLSRAGRLLDGLDVDAWPELDPVVRRTRGLIAFKRKDRREARRQLLSAVKRARQLGDRAEEAVALDSLSDFYRYYGEAGRAEAYLFKALEIKRALGDRHGQAVTLGLLGRLCLQFERYASAQHYFEEDLTIARDLGDSRRVARTMGYIGKAMVGQGKLEQADRKLKVGLMFARRQPGSAMEAELLKELAEVARRSGRMSEARKRLDLASRSYLAAKAPEGAAVTDCLRAGIQLEEGDPRAAYALLESAAGVLRAHNRPAELVPALGLMAQVKREVGERDGAIAILKEAAREAREHHLFRELETIERQRCRLEQSRADPGGDEGSLRFFREFSLHGLRGTVKEYRVVREVGRGTTGVVFEAYDESLAQPVAVKMLRPELSGNAELVARFRRELEAVGLVDHPGVMKIYACGRNDDRFFYVTDYLPGPSLKAWLEKKGPFPAARALPLMARVADALAAVHAAGVVHRDLKPANVLLDADQQPVVVDFGISGKRGKVPSVEKGAVMGTFLYMSLEQMDGRSRPAFAWDVFALGVTFYELLKGRLPFPAKTFPELVRKLQAGRIAPLRSNGKAPPDAVKNLIGRMLAREAKARPSAAEVAEALAGYAEP